MKKSLIILITFITLLMGTNTAFAQSTYRFSSRYLELYNYGKLENTYNINVTCAVATEGATCAVALSSGFYAVSNNMNETSANYFVGNATDQAGKHLKMHVCFTHDKNSSVVLLLEYSDYWFKYILIPN